MITFNIGDKVYSLFEPDKIANVIKIDDVRYNPPVYTVKFEDGNEYANYGSAFIRAITYDDALRYGNILTDDEFMCEEPNIYGFYDDIFTRIRTISYDNRIFYHKMVNGEVIKFKELKA